MAKFLSNIIAYFKTIPDVRVQRRSTYKLYQILTILLIATTAGCKGGKEIKNLAVNYFWFFKLLLSDLENIPSVDTIARTISRIDPYYMNMALLELFAKFRQRALDRNRGRPKCKGVKKIIITLDGKSINSVGHYDKEKKKYYILNSICDGIVLFQMRVGVKTNEITVVPLVLKELYSRNLLENEIITIDVMGCQKSIAELIIRNYMTR